MSEAQRATRIANDSNYYENIMYHTLRMQSGNMMYMKGRICDDSPRHSTFKSCSINLLVVVVHCCSVVTSLSSLLAEPPATCKKCTFIYVVDRFLNIVPCDRYLLMRQTYLTKRFLSLKAANITEITVECTMDSLAPSGVMHVI